MGSRAELPRGLVDRICTVRVRVCPFTVSVMVHAVLFGFSFGSLLIRSWTENAPLTSRSVENEPGANVSLSIGSSVHRVSAKRTEPTPAVVPVTSQYLLWTHFFWMAISAPGSIV
jgi:hypothetical protein